MLFYSSMKGFVHMIHNPVKEISIDMFGKCISGIDGMKFGNWLDVGFSGSGELPMAKPVGHLLVLHTHEVAEDGEGFMLGLIKMSSLDTETVLPIANIQSRRQNCLPAVILQSAATAASSVLPPSKRSKLSTHLAHSHC